MSPEAAQRVLFEQPGLPVLQNRTYPSRDEARNCVKGDVRLVEDLGSGLVHNAAFRPELVAYDSDYQNEQGLSPAFRVHLDAVADIVGRTLPRHGMVELGCGKGFFLEMLAARNFDIAGFDPAYEGSNPRIIKRHFDASVGIQAQGLVLRHVLEHIQDPVEFLFQIQRANGGAAAHLHRGALLRLDLRASRLVRHLLRARELLPHGGLSAHVRHRARERPPVRRPISVRGRRTGVASQARILARRTRSSFPRILRVASTESGRAQSPRTAIWGGASKGVIFAMLKERAGQPVDFAIDINPAKQNAYLPATGLFVESPAAAMTKLPKGSTVFVMNSNYLRRDHADVRKRFQSMSRSNRMSEFDREVAERVAANGQNRALSDAAAAFLRASAPPKYSYNFAWLGRPIIQYPQDIVAMQELIWSRAARTSSSRRASPMAAR